MQTVAHLGQKPVSSSVTTLVRRKYYGHRRLQEGRALLFQAYSIDRSLDGIEKWSLSTNHSRKCSWVGSHRQLVLSAFNGRRSWEQCLNCRNYGISSLGVTLRQSC